MTEHRFDTIRYTGGSKLIDWLQVFILTSFGASMAYFSKTIPYARNYNFWMGLIAGATALILLAWALLLDWRAFKRIHRAGDGQPPTKSSMRLMWDRPKGTPPTIREIIVCLILLITSIGLTVETNKANKLKQRLERYTEEATVFRLNMREPSAPRYVPITPSGAISVNGSLNTTGIAAGEQR